MKAWAKIFSFMVLLSLLSFDLSYSQGARKININEAPAELLETLPGIGPGLAQRIVEYRTENPFETIEDLLGVSGVGQPGFEKIKGLITVTPPLEEAP
ncbi:ComEA family DNA-binding protein [Desulfonatronum thioautotrophicum]|uniref:ComEA family DNA-binding protein n=1 Tax=Desulfonatronum thioautotrophicum TaxID=617001 RepID=UPI00069A819F|nr:helix-hairpin-helix domain-containing protein [Desulfonatronum thioautotrophicum]